MITIYTTPSCSSCRKAKNWLEKHQIEYVDKTLSTYSLKEADIIDILNKLISNDYDEIISHRSNDYNRLERELGPNFLEKLKKEEIIQIILKNPSILKRPIIVDEIRLKVGFHEDEIAIFVSDEIRQQILNAGKGDPILKKYVSEKHAKLTYADSDKVKDIEEEEEEE